MSEEQYNAGTVADLSVYLPRNLSYVEESYLSNFSVSSKFVYNTRRDRETKSRSYRYHVYNSDCFLSEMMDTDQCVSLSADDTVAAKHDTDAPNHDGCEIDCELHCERDRTFSLDSSDTVEEGIFVNDGDSLGSSTTNGRSPTSDDFSIDSINSTFECDLVESQEGREASEGDIDAVSELMMQSLVLDIVEKSASELQTDSSDVKTDKETHEEEKTSNDLNCEAKTTESEEKLPLSTPPKLKLTVYDKPLSFDRAGDGGSQRSILDLFEDSDNDDEEFTFNKAELRKSSSLKSNKTPPGTPRRKKMVRFADAMGLDLESVRHVLNADAPPKIPASAMKDLQVGIEEDRKSIGNRYLTPCFAQPGASQDFLQRVMANKVCLENAVVTNLTITGVVRVANIGFHKFVRIRYSTNGWVTFHDIMASYVQNSCDGPTDRFSFSLVAPADFGLHSRMECAVSYTVGDMTYWDNNSHRNYVFECFAKTTPTDQEDSWVHFL